MLSYSCFLSVRTSSITFKSELAFLCQTIRKRRFTMLTCSFGGGGTTGGIPCFMLRGGILHKPAQHWHRPTGSSGLGRSILLHHTQYILEGVCNRRKISSCAPTSLGGLKWRESCEREEEMRCMRRRKEDSKMRPPGSSPLMRHSIRLS